MKGSILISTFLCLTVNLMAQTFMMNPYGCEHSVLLNGKWNAIIDPFGRGEHMKFFENRKPQTNTQFVEYSFDGLSPFHARAAYSHTVEDSIYVRHDVHRQGIGSALLKNLIERAREIGHHTIIGGIDAQQTASIALHAKHGFVEVGHLRQVGFKFDQWLDAFYMQLML